MPDTTGRLTIHAALCIAGPGALAAVAVPSPAWAWGHTGHVGISELAILSLPSELPKFLRTP